MSEITCDLCGAEFKHAPSLAKHKRLRRCPVMKAEDAAVDQPSETAVPVPESEESGSLPSDESVNDSSPTDGDTSSPPPQDDDLWSSWGSATPEAPPTDRIATEVKILASTAKPRKGGKTRKLSAAERKAMRERSEALVTMAASAYDTGLTTIGRRVTGRDDWLVSHDAGTKAQLASVTVDWAESKDIDLAGVIGPGAVALMFWGAYTAPPAMRLAKEADLSIKPAGLLRRIVSRIPVIGRRFRRSGNETRKNRGMEFRGEE